MDAGLTILVVEDDPVYAQFVAGTLRKAGHRIEVATTGSQARQVASTLRPDAVVLDLGLPDESGYELARALRLELPPASVIILLTANLFPQRDVADAVGIDVVLSKPVEASLVTGMVDLMRERRQRRLRATR